MSDQQEFELEKEMEKVSKFKSFAKFMNNYTKQPQEQVEPPKEPVRQTITKSYQKVANSFDKKDNRSQEKNQSFENDQRPEEREKQKWPSEFQAQEKRYPFQNESKQRLTEEKIVPRPRRQRQFSQVPPPSVVPLNHPVKSPSSTLLPTLPVIKQPPYQFPSNRNEDQLDSYKARFQELNLMFEELKSSTLIQKRRQKQDLFNSQQQVQQLKVRIYELEVRQDQLIMQNKKLKERSNKDFRSEKETQSFKSQMESMSEELRRATEESNYYKGQLDNNKKQLQASNFENERQELELRELRERLECQEREIENKQRLQGELTYKISGLIKENARLRDQASELFKINKELEYQNYSIKRELKRGNQYANQNHDYNHNHSYVNLKQSRRHTREEDPIVEAPKPETKRRRGQFTQERAKINEKREVKEQSYKKQPEPTTRQSNPSSELIKKKAQLETEVFKMRQQKIISGAMRRKKIELERELEEIYTKLQSIQGQPQIRI